MPFSLRLFITAAAFSVLIGGGSASAACTPIHDAAELDAVRNNLTGNYCLANDIDMSAITYFAPIGSNDTPFTGTFSGNGHVISKLQIHVYSSGPAYVGLFASLDCGAQIQDLSLVHLLLTVRRMNAVVGGLAGAAIDNCPSHNVLIQNVHVSGFISLNCLSGSACYVGGIAGFISSYASIGKSSSSASIIGDNSNATLIGGLVGNIAASTASVNDSSATGSVQCEGSCKGGGVAGVNIGVVQNSYATGTVTIGNSGFAGGLVGWGYSYAETRLSYATGKVTCGDSCKAGGLVGAVLANGRVESSYATGSVTCGNTCEAGGLVGTLLINAVVLKGFATGAVTAGDGSSVGGLLGGSIGQTLQAHASGPVNGGATTATYVGGLIGYQNNSGGSGVVTATYAAGRVTGGMGARLGGLIGWQESVPTITASYWDTSTSGRATSHGGSPLTTAQLRTKLPNGFDTAWRITKKFSYPYLDEFFSGPANVAFAAPLAMLVVSSKVFAFLPIGQFDPTQYGGKPTHADGASLAVVYTVIARAVGITDKDPTLTDAKIDQYWDGSAKTTNWTGPVTSHATLGTLQNIAKSSTLNNGNVIGQLKLGNLVILRGKYTKSGTQFGTLWMLATLFTTDPATGTLQWVVAVDPWTGQQVLIDYTTKQVIWPENFPLADFTVNGYQPVTVNN